MTEVVRLSVNVDHVATVRQARRAAYPDPVEAAAAAEAAGAHGITVHLRSDRRHIQDDDVRRLRGTVRGKLNLEMAATDEMVALAVELRPHQVTLVPERPEEVTTEGGLDVVRHAALVRAAAARLAAAGVATSVFVDPDLAQIDALTAIGLELVPGFEINTDAYTRAVGPAVAPQLAACAATAAAGKDRGFRVYAGHGLTTSNVGPIATLPAVEELNIGHFLVARAVVVGLPEAVREMLAAIAAR